MKDANRIENKTVHVLMTVVYTSKEGENGWLSAFALGCFSISGTGILLQKNYVILTSTDLFILAD
jgi:hypothetical protein